jgi:hypothetical protein
MARGYARGRERDAAARAALKPLAPGERPLAVTLAALLAAVLGVSNVVLLVAGYEVDDNGQSAVGALIFEALLGIAIVFSALSLMVASNLTAVALCLAIIAIASPLFWFLIRAMARIQMPSRRPHEPVG